MIFFLQLFKSFTLGCSVGHLKCPLYGETINAFIFQCNILSALIPIYSSVCVEVNGFFFNEFPEGSIVDITVNAYSYFIDTVSLCITL